MSEFKDLISQLEGKAAQAWQAAKSEALHIEQELIPVIEDAFAAAIRDFGSLAAQTVIQFMAAEFNQLSGAEKHGNVVTTLIQSAEAQAKTLALADAQALAKSAYLAVVGTAP